jgi:hypothetical protein
MKKISVNMFITCLISISLSAKTPLTVDAGKDTSYCIKMNYSGYRDSSNYTTIKIGGISTAIDGTPPYSYSWKMYSKTTRKQFNLLADSGIDHKANPELKISNNYYFNATQNDSLNDRFIFKVIVMDSNKATVEDSCIITISRYGMPNIYFGGPSIPCMEIFTKDSIQLGPCNIVGGIPPFSSFKWMPTYGLSNPNISNPKAVLVSGYNYTNYSVSFIDSAGCTLNSGMTLTDIKDGDLNTGFVTYKNPITNNGTMNFTSDLLGSIVQVYSINGVVHYQSKVEELNIPLGSVISTAGIYFYRVITPLGKLITGRFVRE